jgi:hypothetical protein
MAMTGCLVGKETCSMYHGISSLLTDIEAAKELGKNNTGGVMGIPTNGLDLSFRQMHQLPKSLSCCLQSTCDGAAK